MKRFGLRVINLGRDTRRLDHMAAELAKTGLPFDRFPAVEGLSVPEWLRPWFFDADGNLASPLKPGEIGVYASHLSLHRQLLDDDHLDWLLVMEDDLEIDPDLADLLAALAARAPDFDILKLSNPPKAAYLDHGDVCPGRSLVTYSRVPNNLGAYLISRSGAAKTTRFRGLRTFAIDEDMRCPWDWDLETLGIVPAPIRANIFDTSSIDAMGDRGLGRETFLQKLRRRRWEGPAGWVRRIRWQWRHLGGWGYFRCILATLLNSLSKRFRPTPGDPAHADVSAPRNWLCVRAGQPPQAKAG